MPFHNKFNASERDYPNPYINFIRVLGDGPQEGRYDENRQFHDQKERAREILKAIAAQVRPLMKEHGMGLNSLVEHEWNPAFAGRNWNGGEIIEIVLRRPDGGFFQMQMLLSVMAHELAHIHHMNHGPAFQALNAKLRNQIWELQAKGYYGPGFWSSGQRLRDSERQAGDAHVTADHLPEYTCGGAERRGPARRRFIRRSGGTKRHATRDANGREKKRKAGGRVRSATAFVGDGNVVDAEGGTTFRKRASAKNAKEARAAAAEKRIRKMKGEPTTSDEDSDEPAEADDNVADSEEVYEIESDWEEYEDDAAKTGPDRSDRLRSEFGDIFKLFNFEIGDAAAGPSGLSSKVKGKARKTSSAQQDNSATEEDEDVAVVEPEKEKAKASSSPKGKTSLARKRKAIEQIGQGRKVNGFSLRRDDHGDDAADGGEASRVKDTNGKRNPSTITNRGKGKGGNVIELADSDIADEDDGLPAVTARPSSTNVEAAPAKGPAPPSEASRMQWWKCLVCLTENHPDLGVCEFCASRKGQVPDWS